MLACRIEAQPVPATTEPTGRTRRPRMEPQSLGRGTCVSAGESLRDVPHSAERASAEVTADDQASAGNCGGAGRWVGPRHFVHRMGGGPGTRRDKDRLLAPRSQDHS